MLRTNLSADASVLRRCSTCLCVGTKLEWKSRQSIRCHAFAHALFKTSTPHSSLAFPDCVILALVRLTMAATTQSSLSDTKSNIEKKEALGTDVPVISTYEHGAVDGPAPFSAAQTKALLRKLDWHMIPYLSLL